MDHLAKSRNSRELKQFVDAWDSWDKVYRDMSRTAISQIFLKLEATKVSDPRNISPRHLLIQMLAMEFVYPLEAHLKTQSTEQSWAVKGLNNEGVMEAMGTINGGVLAYEADHKRFDAHVNEFTRNLELEILCNIFPADDEFLRFLLPLFWKMVGVSALGVMIKVLFERSSGELWTSLCNLLTNTAHIYYSFSRYLPGVKYKHKGEGDDAVGMVWTEDEELVREALHKGAADMGLEVDVIIHSSLDSASFLARYWNVPLRVNCADIKRCLSKFHLTGRTLQRRGDVLSLLKAKALSLSVTDASTPCIWAILRACLRETQDVAAMTDLKEVRWRTGEEREPCEPSMEVRCWVERTQGISVAEQLQFEKQFERGIPAVVHFPLFTGFPVQSPDFVIHNADLPPLLELLDFNTVKELNGQ